MSWLRQATLAVSGYQIAYCAAGPPESRDPLVCVHGAGGNRSGWVRLMRALARRNLASLALELPGHGKSDPARISDVREYSRILLGFLEAKRMRSAPLAGHSMGGAVVLQSALSDAASPRGVVLIGAGARLRVKDSILEGVQTRFEQTVDEIVGYVFSPAADPDLVREGARTLRECPADTLRGDFIACNRFDLLSEVEAVSAPALVVCGEDDVLTPPRYARFLAEKIPDARLSIVAQAGHMAMLEQPGAVGGLIAQFLDDLP